MSEATTETAKTQTEAATSQATTETATTLLSAAESKTEQASSEQTQATDTKTEATTEQKTETKTETKTEGAPEKYEFKDADKYDATVLGLFSEAAKEANLSQDAAQKLLDTMAPKFAERTQVQVEAIHKQWVDSSTADKEFGGDKLKENLGIAKKGLDMLDPIPADSKLLDAKGKPTTAFRAFLEESGAGNHPEVIRILYRAGKAISEDKFVSGQAAVTESDPAKRLFPNQA